MCWVPDANSKVQILQGTSRIPGNPLLYAPVALVKEK